MSRRPTESLNWRYTVNKLSANWFQSIFNGVSWRVGKSGFGTAGTPGAVAGTTWNSSDIWLRREFELPDCKFGALQLWVHYDEDAKIFVNGVPALSEPGEVCLCGEAGFQVADYSGGQFPSELLEKPRASRIPGRGVFP